LLEVAAILRSSFGEMYPIPQRKAPKVILWLLPALSGFTRRYIARNLNIPLALDNRRSREDLGVRYRPIETTVCEHFRQLFPQAVIGRHSEVSGEVVLG
jgi:hypothetical protein